jgi:hypothetical protein
MAIGQTVDISTRKLQSAVNKVAIWTRKWWIKLWNDGFKTSQTRRLENNQSSSMVQKFHMPTQLNILARLLMPCYNGKSILRKNVSSTSSSGKCTGCLDAILSCQSTIKYYTSKLYIQFGVMSYGIQLRGCASNSNIQVIHCYQNKLPECIISAPWNVRNSDHRDLRIQMVTDTIAKFANSHEKRLQDHINIEASRLLNVNNMTSRLKRKKPFELVRR